MKTTLFIIFATLVSACEQEKKNASKESNNGVKHYQCMAEQSQCQFVITSGQIDVLFDVEKIVAEQPFNLLVSYQGREIFNHVSGYLEGEDMFMGKIPLIIESTSLQVAQDLKMATIASPLPRNNQVFKAEVLVGSCSATQMKWRIWLNFQTNDGVHYAKTFTVNSSRY